MFGINFTDFIVYFIMGIIAMAIVLSLASSLFYFLKGESPQDAKQVARSLTLRIILSLILFVMLIIAYFMGWLHPHGLEF